MTEVRERRKRVTDAAMLDAARDAFVADGFEAAGMETIAAAAGTTKVTLYARYGSKQGLFRAALDREVAALQTRLVAAYGSDPSASPVDRLHRYVSAYFDVARQQPQGFRLLFLDDGEGQATGAVGSVQAVLTDRIAVLVAGLRGARRPSRDDALLASLIVGATHHGAGAAVAQGAPLAAAERATERFLAAAIGGALGPRHA